MFDPSHKAALDRLHAFVPHAGRDYAAARNIDDTAHVSLLSPYIRHRIITETCVLHAVLARHSHKATEKFVQELFWRTYWKGWLEQRPGVWLAYREALTAALNQIQTQSGLRQRWQAACLGQTGIDGFDHWAQQLAQTGYLHNHARMWFASIWIHTLQLPWALGADLFLRHLLDGDPASNTLSWRWVAGMQTPGKAYLAQFDTIAKYTKGRFRPQGLAAAATAIHCPPNPEPKGLPGSSAVDPNLRQGLLITEEDLSPGWLLDRVTPVATAFVQTTAARSPLQVAPQVVDFVGQALADCQTRFAQRLGAISVIAPGDLAAWRHANGLDQVVTSYIPVGPTADALREADLVQVIRPYDAGAWPYASRGFFRFKGAIPALLGQIKGLRVAD